MSSPLPEPGPDPSGLAARHAAELLRRLGLPHAPVRPDADHPALAWRRAGLLEITGRADGPGLVAPLPLCAAADGAMAALRTLAPHAVLPRGAALLGERARLLGLRRRGRVSANGSCRLLRTLDGSVALNLPRSGDRELLPALFGAEVANDRALALCAAGSETAALLERGRLLGLAIAAAQPPDPAAAPFHVKHAARPRLPTDGLVPMVLDMSPLWAGPLAASLLESAGARVVKLEGTRRPDGARFGDRRVFDLLNAHKQCVALDFADPADGAVLRRLVSRADIVIEGSRPRALRQLGVDADTFARDGGTWISITAHGREDPQGDWIGFGDDAAVAGGLAHAMGQGWGEPLFAGDAIADPLCGVTAALAALALWRTGGGMAALALSRVVAHAAALGPAGQALTRWQRLAEADDAPLYPLRVPTAAARPAGADTQAILHEIGIV